MLAPLDTAVEALAHADVSGLDGPQLLALVSGVERLRRRMDAASTRLVAEVETQRLAGEYARSSTADLLVTTLRISPADARARVARAQATAPRTTLTGQPLPAMLPAAQHAAEEGEIAGAHVDVVIDCLDHVPPTLSAQACSTVEATLVEAARHEHPQALRRTAALLLARLDPDGIAPREDEVHRQRHLTLGRNADGSGRVTGRLTAEATAVWDVILDALSAPRCETDGGDRDGEPDHRSASQRRHDALVEAGQRLLRSGSLPAAGGVPVTVLVRTVQEEFDSDTGIAHTARGDLLSMRAIRAMSGDAELVPIVTDEAGAVLALGRTRRLASRAQRLALASRDGGCTFPNCDRPAAWTEAHHVRPWQDGGTTDLDNMCLVCRFHHREFQARGWAVRMSGGVPEWIPPPWLDRDRRPQRNRAHHRPDITFDSPAASTNAA